MIPRPLNGISVVFPALVTVNTNEDVPVVPSSAVTLFTDKVGSASSFVIEPIPVLSVIAAVLGAEAVADAISTLNVWFASYLVSPQTPTVNVLDASFDANARLVEATAT